ncbi:MAG: 50S ribosomal protein L30 [Geminicoccaceae bacterium]|jgi:large subunit ribosomal protein L30|nr:50S ribosomal protein L30 [Geminicoccaceae bacterium]HRY24539.1 50S ribosomal protein L30 [Geminicoccaceae bacterium]
MAKTSKTAKTIKVTQTGSPIGRPADQERTLISLGLNKLWRSREVTDTPANRGRIRKVEHLLRVESDGA